MAQLNWRQQDVWWLKMTAKIDIVVALTHLEATDQESSPSSIDDSKMSDDYKWIQIQIMGVIYKMHEHAAIIYPQIYKHGTRREDGH